MLLLAKATGKPATAPAKSARFALRSTRTAPRHEPPGQSEINPKTQKTVRGGQFAPGTAKASSATKAASSLPAKPAKKAPKEPAHASIVDIGMAMARLRHGRNTTPRHLAAYAIAALKHGDMSPEARSTASHLLEYPSTLGDTAFEGNARDLAGHLDREVGRLLAFAPTATAQEDFERYASIRRGWGMPLSATEEARNHLQYAREWARTRAPAKAREFRAQALWLRTASELAYKLGGKTASGKIREAMVAAAGLDEKANEYIRAGSGILKAAASQVAAASDHTAGALVPVSTLPVDRSAYDGNRSFSDRVYTDGKMMLRRKYIIRPQYIRMFSKTHGARQVLSDEDTVHIFKQAARLCTEPVEVLGAAGGKAYLGAPGDRGPALAVDAGKLRLMMDAMKVTVVRRVPYTGSGVPTSPVVCLFGHDPGSDATYPVGVLSVEKNAPAISVKAAIQTKTVAPNLLEDHVEAPLDKVENHAAPAANSSTESSAPDPAKEKALSAPKSRDPKVILSWAREEGMRRLREYDHSLSKGQKEWIKVPGSNNTGPKKVYANVIGDCAYFQDGFRRWRVVQAKTGEDLAVVTGEHIARRVTHALKDKKAPVSGNLTPARKEKIQEITAETLRNPLPTWEPLPRVSGLSREQQAMLDDYGRAGPGAFIHEGESRAGANGKAKASFRVMVAGRTVAVVQHKHRDTAEEIAHSALLEALSPKAGTQNAGSMKKSLIWAGLGRRWAIGLRGSRGTIMKRLTQK